MAGQVESAENVPLFFNAKYKFGIDAKRRLQIPAKWRKVLGVSVFTLMIWRKEKQGTCLLALPPAAMNDLMQKIKEKPFSRTEDLRRRLGSRSEDVVLDSASRICLPDKLASAAGLKKQALLVGLFDLFQIWDPKRYAAVEDLDGKGYDDDILTELGL